MPFRSKKLHSVDPMLDRIDEESSFGSVEARDRDEEPSVLRPLDPFGSSPRGIRNPAEKRIYDRLWAHCQREEPRDVSRGRRPEPELVPTQ